MNKKYLLTRLFIPIILIFSVSLLWAQSDNAVYLPLVVKPDSTPIPTSAGATKILAAGEFALRPESDPAPSGEKSKPATEKIQSDGPLKSITCTTQEWSASNVRKLTNRIAFGADVGIIYPGALIQGNSYQNGTFTPITIPRSGGTITLEGVTLLPNSSYSRDVSVMKPDEVQDAIKNILESYDPTGGTAANYGDDFQQTYSYQHMLFTLGIDARYGIGEMEADLSIDSTKKTNYVFYKFQQKFYDVVYTPPESLTSVFRDGGNFAEPDPNVPQIGPGNPPLYVHKVSYGRIVYFVAESQYSAKNIEATLRAAVDAKKIDVELETGLTYEEVMKNTRITTFVLGGNAGDAVQNIKAGSAKNRFKAIGEFVGSYGNANFSAQNPASPISYELRYLKNRQVAQMSYTTVFDKNDCETTLQFPEPPPANRKMWIRFTDVDDTATLYYGGGNTQVHRFKCVGGGKCNESSTTRTAIHTWLTRKGYDLNDNHTFRLELKTGLGDGSVKLNYYVDTTNRVAGAKSWYCDATIIHNCDSKKTWYYTVNVNKGIWKNQ